MRHEGGPAGAAGAPDEPARWAEHERTRASARQRIRTYLRPIPLPRCSSPAEGSLQPRAAGALDPCRPAARRWPARRRHGFPRSHGPTEREIAGPWLTTRTRSRRAKSQWVTASISGTAMRRSIAVATCAEVKCHSQRRMEPRRSRPGQPGQQGTRTNASRAPARTNPSGAPARTSPRLAGFLSFSRPPCCGRTGRAVSLTVHPPAYLPLPAGFAR
jgi:hypothetical protein